MPTTVAILGASENPARASNMACRLLVEHGHTTYAVSLHGRSIHGASGRTDLSEITEPLDTITVYISPRHQPTVLPALLAAHPQRVIFNPGSESPETEKSLRAAGMETLEACTLVLLTLGQF